MESETFFETFAPGHPLILKDECNLDEDSVPPCCLVCGKKITSDHYFCTDENCEVFIHKSCTELPLNILHPLHPDHPLYLASRNYGFLCDACGKQWKDYSYYCYLCDFDLDLTCASITTKSIEHPSHKHPLKTNLRTFLCRCDACGTEHKGMFYSCSTCDQFWIHEDCASLPATFENNDYHDHPLTLAYSLPDQYTTFSQLCQICEKDVVSGIYWVYHCGKCRFLVHVKCVTPQSEHFLSVLLPKKEFYSSHRKSKMIAVSIEDSDLPAVHLPLPDDINISLADHLSSSIRSRAVDNTACRPKYFHGQPLVLCFDDVQGSDPRLDILHDHTEYQNKLCNACIRPVTTTPFYKCDDECNFILHESCADLPVEIQYPLHSRHGRLLLENTKEFDYFLCDGCDFWCNGFRYVCNECEYQLDVICASLPSTIKYDAHANHTMSLKERISRHCNACYKILGESSIAFGCDSCDFELHTTCATYPSKVRHRYDDVHPFSLTYRPVEDHDSDYLCDICEIKIDPMWWFFHCVECDISMHVYCHPTYDQRSRIKFGGILTVKSHAHPLVMVPVIPKDAQCNGYVRVVTDGTLCSECGDDINAECELTAFKCLECKYNIDYLCLKGLIDEGVGCNIVDGF